MKKIVPVRYSIGQIKSCLIRQYTVLEVAPINKPLGGSDYSPIEKVLLGIAEELPKLKNREISTFTLCAKGSKVSNSIETVEPLKGWYDPSHELTREKYAEHFEQIKTLTGIDIIHNHISEFLKFLQKNKINTPAVNTVHISPSNKAISSHKSKEGIFYVAISEAHKRELENGGIEVSRVIYNGIATEEIPFDPYKEDYVLCMGRITPDKGQNIAIKAAKEAGHKIVIAGPIQNKSGDREYFEHKIRLRIELIIDFENDPVKGMKQIINTSKKVIYVSEVGISKYDLYRKARALLFPIQWSEPFGLVMIEALAAGTPVIAYNRGSVPEIVEDGVSGFILEDGNLDGLTNGISLADKIDPINCRKQAMKFSRRTMAENYADFFEEIIGYRC